MPSRMASLSIVITLRAWRGRSQMQQENWERRTCCWQWRPIQLRTSGTLAKREISLNVLSHLRSERARKKLPQVTLPHPPYGKHYSVTITKHDSWQQMQSNIRADETWIMA